MFIEYHVNSCEHNKNKSYHGSQFDNFEFKSYISFTIHLLNLEYTYLDELCGSLTEIIMVRKMIKKDKSQRRRSKERCRLWYWWRHG